MKIFGIIKVDCHFYSFQTLKVFFSSFRTFQDLTLFYSSNSTRKLYHWIEMQKSLDNASKKKGKKIKSETQFEIHLRLSFETNCNDDDNSSKEKKNTRVNHDDDDEDLKKNPAASTQIRMKAEKKLFRDLMVKKCSKWKYGREIESIWQNPQTQRYEKNNRIPAIFHMNNVSIFECQHSKRCYENNGKSLNYCTHFK